MSDLEFDGDSDQQQQISENHSELIDTIRQLDKGQRYTRIFKVIIITGKVIDP